MLAIQAENLTRKFGPVTAVDRLNLSVKRGEIFGLVGPDGSGKTTIIRLFSGILQPTSGDARVLGHAVSKEAEPLKARIGYLAQRFALYGDLTVMENIRFYADLYDVPRKERIPRIERLLSFSNLAPFKDRLAQDLSGGMKQKLGLTCALVHTPEILFLDEPTNGVDPVSRRDFWRILYDLLREGVTIFVSTAYLDEAERCHRIGLMHQGRLLSIGSPKEIKDLMKGELWEVHCERRMKAVEILKDLSGVKGAVIFGDKIHVLLEDGDGAREEMERALRQTGFEVLSLRKIPPSLEDVFIATVPAPPSPPASEEKG
ncbi:MAG: multidrug ABC transporter ATP-binding protein [Deltaproteobacteria bacterium SM23_61]|nr:MAG: multidrug ABC transporter ATP-binding protein [Deltaproteobacteria bacterium SM23_61]